MKPAGRLALLLSLISGTVSGLQNEALASPMQPHRLPVTGPTTQFLIMGAVFMILGASFVFAPQIVSGVNRFFGLKLKSKRKAAAPALEEAVATAEAETGTAPPTDEEIFAPSRAVTPNSEVISQLRDAINASWRDRASSGGRPSPT